MMRYRRLVVMAILAIGLGPTSVKMMAQESSGRITGIITDSTHAVVAGAHVAAVNVATEVPTKTVTNASGNYALLYLIPGIYSVTVEQPGFEKLVRSGVQVRVGDDLKLDLSLTVGATRQTVTVDATAPLIEAANANMGATINRSDLEHLPLIEGNPITLTQLAAGATYTGDPLFNRPFDNGTVSGVQVNGAERGNSNEWTLNGMPNSGPETANSPRSVAYIPPADAVQEFKMTTGSFTATLGHSVSSNIDLVLKSGTNELHGSAYEFLRNEAFAANDFFSNQRGAPRSRTRYNRFGGSLGGPVVIPKIYNGRQKTFFFLAVEGILDAFPEPKFFTVPTQAMRNGDFSALPNPIYDPLTAQTCGQPNTIPCGATGEPTVIRQPFANNIIPANRISPIAKAYLQFFPLPNATPKDTIGTDDYFSPQTRTDKYYNDTLRIDHTISDNQRISGTYINNWRQEKRFHWALPVNGFSAAGQDIFNVNHGLTGDYLLTLSPTTLLDIRGGADRFDRTIVPPNIGFNPATLGFSPAVTALMQGMNGQTFTPPFSINQFSTMSHSANGYTWAPVISETVFAQPTVTKIVNEHTLSFGYEARLYREYGQSLGNGEGLYTFNQDFTRQTNSGSSFTCIQGKKGCTSNFQTQGNQDGQGFAAFLLGQPTTGNIDRNVTRSLQELTQSLFVQDDWKALPGLTLNLGLRYDLELPTTERFNRNTRGFDFTDPNPIAAQAITNFGAILAKAGGSFPTGTSAPVTSISPSGQVLGGYLYATPSNRGIWVPDWRNLQPRFGFAYQLFADTVLRGGWGLYSTPWTVSGNSIVNQSGFSQSTALVPSNDNGLTFVANLANPFPNGVVPINNNPNLTTNVGSNLFIFPVHPKTQLTQGWALDLQHQFHGEWLLDIGYVGRHGYHLIRTSNFLNGIPTQYLSTLPVHDPLTDILESNTIPNPFKGLLPGNGSGLNTGNFVKASQLVRAFPEFGTISTQIFDGSNDYHALQVQAQHRFKHGYSVIAAYTWSKLTEMAGFPDDFDTAPTHRLSPNDAPHRFSVASVVELPFGRRRLIGKNWPGAVEQVFGGWEVSGIYAVQTGFPIQWGNVAFFGDPNLLQPHISASTLNHVFDTSGFYFTDAAVQTNGVVNPTLQRSDQRIKLQDNIRTFPVVLGNFRGEGENNVDLTLSKRFPISENKYLEFRAVALNAFNRTWFSNPNVDPQSASFGVINSQRNFPRQMELALKIVF